MADQKTVTWITFIKVICNGFGKLTSCLSGHKTIHPSIHPHSWSQWQQAYQSSPDVLLLTTVLRHLLWESLIFPKIDRIWTPFSVLWVCPPQGAIIYLIRKPEPQPAARSASTLSSSQISEPLTLTTFTCTSVFQCHSEHDNILNFLGYVNRIICWEHSLDMQTPEYLHAYKRSHCALSIVILICEWEGPHEITGGGSLVMQWLFALCC